MASEKQARRRVSRQIAREAQSVRKAATPKLWQGYSKNNLGNVIDASGTVSTGFVSGNESVATGDPVCFVAGPGQPGAVVRRTVPSVAEWRWVPRALGRFLAILNHYGTNTIDRVGIRDPVRTEPPEPIEDLRQAGDNALIWADSPSDWFGLTWELRNNDDELVWIDRGQAQLITAPEVAGLTALFGDLQYVLTNHFAQGFYGITPAGVAGPLVAKNYFFDMRLGQLSSAALAGSYTPPAGSPPGSVTPGSFRVQGDVELFKGLLLDATFEASHDYSRGVEEIDGPWPIPGARYQHYFFRHRSNATYQPGLGYPIGENPCDPSYRTNMLSLGNPWGMPIPRPVGYEDHPYAYLYAFSVASPVIYSDPQATIPITNISYKSVVGGDQDFFLVRDYPPSVLAVLNPIEQLTVTSVYPDDPVIPSEFYTGQFLSPTSTEGFTLVYSNIEPCQDPRPYTRRFEQYRQLATGNRYQPIARNENRLIYHSATNIDYSFISARREAVDVGDTRLADLEVYRETTWSADHKCYLHDLDSGEKTEVSAYPPISLPFPNIDMAETGVPYNFNYSNISGFEYRKFSPAPNNGSVLYEDYDPLGELTAVSAVSSGWKGWFAAIVAKGDIPCFGKTYGLISRNPDVYGVKLYKGRITAIDYDDSLTDIRPIISFYSNFIRSANANSWPVEWLSFTLVIDDFLAELANERYVEGCSFMGFDDLIFLGGSALTPDWSGLAVLDTGSLLNTSVSANSDYAYDLAHLEIGLTLPLYDATRELKAGYLYQLPRQSLAGYQVRYIWRTLATDPPEDEITVMYRYDQDSSFSFAAYQLDDLIFPERPGDGIYTLHPVFKLAKNEVSGIYEVFFDRIDLIPNDITREYLEDPDNNVYKFADANVLPPE